MTMLWAIRCPDNEGSAAARAAARPMHSRRLAEAAAGFGPVRPLLYGALADELEGRTAGSLIIAEADGADEVRKFLADDPFTTAGVWGEPEISGFLPSVRSPVSLRRAERAE